MGKRFIKSARRSRRARYIRYFAAAAAIMVAAAVAVAGGLETPGGGPALDQAPKSSASGPPQKNVTMVFVSPSGSDSNDGSRAAPLRTIQAALAQAGPGTTITLAPGVYREQPVTVRDGAPGAPITIKGPESGTNRAGRYQATLFGTGRVFSINNSYYTLDGFTIDGQEKLAKTPFPLDLSKVNAFKDKVQPSVADGRLIYIGAAEKVRDTTGVTISNMFLSGAGGECVRLRNNAHGNTVTTSVIQYCGMFGKAGNTDRAAYHNGEGVYIGTSPKSKNQPMSTNDASSNNIVTKNIIRTFGSECFDVKENAHDNVFEQNLCSANAESTEYKGSNVELRGYLNTVRGNRFSDSAGYNVKIESDNGKYDNGGNSLENNLLSGSPTDGIRLESTARQGPICGNVMQSPNPDDGELPGDPSAACPTGGTAPH